MKLMFIKNIPISHLLLLVYTALLTGLLTVGVNEYKHQQKTHHIISELLNKSLHKQAILIRMRKGSDYVHVNLLRFLYYTEKKAKNEALKTVLAEGGKNDSNLKEYEKLVTDPHEQRLFNKLRSFRVHYAKVRATLIQLIEEGRHDEAVNFNLRFVYSAFQNFQQAQTTLSDYAGKKDNTNIKNIEDQLHTIEATKLWLNGSILILLTLLGILLSRIIGKLRTNNLQLAEREHKYHLLAENTHEIISQCDAEGRLVFANDSFKQKLEYSDEEIFSLTVPDILSEESKYLYKAYTAKAEFGEIISNIRLTLKSKSEKIIMVEGNIVLDYQSGLFSGVTAFFNDITERERVLMKLKESNQRYQYATRATSDAIWDWDLANNTLYWGEGFQTIFGYTSQGFKTDVSSWTAHIHPEDIERVVSGIYQVINGVQTNWSDEYRYCKSDQTYAHVADNGFVIRDEQGKAIRMVGAMQDITWRKKAETDFINTLKEKNTILESIRDAFFAVDKNWKVTYWNKEAEKVLGRHKEDILNHNLWDVYSSSVGSESYGKYHLALETNQVVHFEDYYPPLEKWYEISAYPSDNGLSVYFKDVTERKLSEIRLRELNESIRKHVKELAVSNAELEQFAYVASHDLQEPLRMVTSFLTQIEKKYGNVIDDNGKKYIGFAVDGARRMRQIILDLLEFSKVGKTEDTQEDLNLNDLLSEILVLCRKQIAEKNAMIHAGKLPVIRAYKTPLRQVFQNLISNALKYSQQGIPAQIHISAIEFKNYWQFIVSDNGIGIRKEYFDKIFVIFQRLHNKDDYPGTGMGLAVTKKIIENQGGKIWVESEEGKGSKFYFTIIKT